MQPIFTRHRPNLHKRSRFHHGNGSNESNGGQIPQPHVIAVSKNGSKQIKMCWVDLSTQSLTGLNLHPPVQIHPDEIVNIRLTKLQITHKSWRSHHQFDLILRHRLPQLRLALSFLLIRHIHLSSRSINSGRKLLLEWEIKTKWKTTTLNQNLSQTQYDRIVFSQRLRKITSQPKQKYKAWNRWKRCQTTQFHAW